MLSRCTQMLCIPGVPRHLASLTKNKGVFFKAADLHGEVMMGLCISLLLWNCSTVALNSCNPSLHTVEKFQICLPEHEAAVSNKRFAAVPAESARVSCIMSGLLCLHFAGIPLETCFQSFAVTVQLVFPRALKSVCLGRLSLKPVHPSGISGRI